MELKKLDIDGVEVTFVNKFVSRRYNFQHVSTLFIDGVKEMTHVSTYINRTWERYTYQTAMLGAVDDLIEQGKKAELERFKTEHGIKRLTAERRAEFEQKFEQLEQTAFLRKVKAELL